LICGFACPPALAGDIRDSIPAASAAAAAAASGDTTIAPRDRASYRWIGLALIGGGAAMTLAGFLRPTGVEVSVQPRFPLRPSITAETTHNHALGALGLGVMGTGAVLLVVGEEKRRPAVISVGPNQIAVAKVLRF
jgi:hypothetical protein